VSSLNKKIIRKKRNYRKKGDECDFRDPNTACRIISRDEMERVAMQAVDSK